MYEKLEKQKADRFKSYKTDQGLKNLAKRFINTIVRVGWGFNSSWLGVPLFQTPIDMYAFQEIIWKVKPDLIIETGIMYGGSLIHSASMLALLEYCGHIENGHVIGIDVKLPELEHPLMDKITMLNGSSTDPEIVDIVKEMAKGKKVMVFLDSAHSHNHVLAELKIYSELVSVGSYCVVEDTQLDVLPPNIQPAGRKGNNPRTAVLEFMKNNNKFVFDKDIENRIVFLAYNDGYLRRIK